MPARILSNTLPLPEDRRSVSEALVNALRDFAGDWEISIVAEQKNDAWQVRVKGPNDFDSKHNLYFGEHNPTSIATWVRSAVERAKR